MLSHEWWELSKSNAKLPNGDSLAYVERGDRQSQTLLFIHGLSDSSRSFSLMDSYMDGYCRVIVDLPSHGSSSAGSQAHSIEGYAQVIADFVRSQGLRKPILVGHSLGAMVGCHAAAALRDEISGLICINGAARPSWDAENPLITEIRALPDPIDPKSEFFDSWHATTTTVCNQFMKHVRSEAVKVPRATWLSLLQSIANANLAIAAREVSVPARIVFGCSDHLFDISQQEMLVQWLRADALVKLESCGHNPHWDAPQRTAAEIKAFAQELFN
jgi:pimeloyl-ACP methyl ester carboxylesterase